LPKQGQVFVPPTLYANLSQPKSVLVHATIPPTIPLANAILVSRISSPASTAKSLEAAFIAALKRHFESCSRIIRVGDFFALAIDETLSQFPVDDNPDDNDRRKRPNAISWYRVEKVTVTAGKTGSEYTGDVYVDPASTKMLQSYYAASTIPLYSLALQSYLGIPHLPIPDDESLRRMKGFMRLKSLSEAVLSSFGKEANLSLLSVLIHGARGVGKKTIAEWVATRLGLHFFEVACFWKSLMKGELL
jgi:peroxin-6